MKPLIILLMVIALAACTNDLPPLPDDPIIEPPGPIIDDPEPPEHEANVTYREGSWHYRVIAAKPTPCHVIEQEIVIEESDPEHILVALKTDLHTDEACPAVVTFETIEGTVEGSEHAAFTIMLDGAQIHHTRGGYECTTVYEPVCGQPPMPPCPPGFGCPDVMPLPETYPNECEMQRAGAELIHEGECENDLALT